MANVETLKENLTTENNDDIPMYNKDETAQENKKLHILKKERKRQIIDERYDYYNDLIKKGMMNTIIKNKWKSFVIHFLGMINGAFDGWTTAFSLGKFTGNGGIICGSLVQLYYAFLLPPIGAMHGAICGLLTNSTFIEHLLRDYKYNFCSTVGTKKLDFPLDYHQRVPKYMK